MKNESVCLCANHFRKKSCFYQREFVNSSSSRFLKLWKFFKNKSDKTDRRNPGFRGPVSKISITAQFNGIYFSADSIPGPEVGTIPGLYFRNKFRWRRKRIRCTLQYRNRALISLISGIVWQKLYTNLPFIYTNNRLNTIWMQLITIYVNQFGYVMRWQDAHFKYWEGYGMHATTQQSETIPKLKHHNFKTVRSTFPE